MNYPVEFSYYLTEGITLEGNGSILILTHRHVLGMSQIGAEKISINYVSFST